MNPVFVLPPAFYQWYPRWVITNQPFTGYSSQSVLDNIPDSRLEEYQRAFLSGETFQPVESFVPPLKQFDLAVGICQSLSTCGSLKKGPTPGFPRPNLGEISLESAMLKSFC